MKGNGDRDKPPPKNWLSSLKTRFLQRQRKKRALTKQDIVDYIDQAQKSSVISAETHSMIKGAMAVADRQVRDIMVARSRMTCVSHDATLGDLLNEIIEPGYSRYPVIGDNRDEILGILLAKDLLSYSLHNDNDNFNLMDQLRPVLFVPESKRLNSLLKQFRSAHTHMAIVVNEYGGVGGLVTIEDVLEQIVGEIEDEHDIPEDLAIKKLSESQFMINAMTPVMTFNEYFDTDFDEQSFDTIGGLVTHKFGYLPKRNETLDYYGFRFKVVQANHRRIEYLLVNRETSYDSQASSAE